MKIKNKIFTGVLLGFLILLSLAVMSRYEQANANHTTVTPSGGFHPCNVVGQTTAGTDSPTAGIPDGCNGVSSTVNLNLFGKSTVDNGPVDRGISSPSYFSICNGYIWVSDSSNNRVLGFTVNGTNVLADRIADVILTGNGTDNDAFIGANTAGTTQSTFTYPTGLACDSTNKRLFVLDRGNNRVLAFDVTSPTNGMNASYVIGQSVFTSASTGTTATTLNTSSAVARSGLAYYNNLLFVADTGNNRVLAFPTASIASGMSASSVLGQSTFTAGSAATTQGGLSAPAGLAVDTSGDRLFVADYGNRRVLLYDIIGLVDVGYTVGSSGTVVRTMNGGSTWSSQTSGTSNGLNSVYSITGGRTGYAVGDSGTILKTTNGGTSWSSQTSNTVNNLLGVTCSDANTCYASGGTGSDFIILKTTNGGTSWTSKASGTNVIINGVGCADANTCWFPKNGGNLAKTSDGGDNFSLLTSGTTNHLNGISVVDTNTVFIVGASGTIIKTSNGGTDWSVQTSGTSNNLKGVYFVDSNTGYAVGHSGTILKTTNGGTSWSTQTSGTANDLKSISCIDTSVCYVVGASGTILKTTNGGTAWSSQTSGTSVTLIGVRFLVGTNGENASNVLGQANFTSTAEATTQGGMKLPQGLMYDGTGSLLYVVDTTNNRVLVHSASSPSDGQNASNVLGQANFTSSASATTAPGLSAPTGIGYDSTNKLLYVGDSTNNRMITYDVNTIGNGEDATDCLGQLGASDACVFTKGTAQNRPNARGANAPRGVVVGNSKLFVSDTSNNRVLVYNLDSNGQLVDRVADNVLGQASLHSGTSTGTTSTTLSSPRALAYDSSNNRLFVYDHGNNRVIIYDVTAISDGEAAAKVLCQTNFTSSSTGTTASTCNFQQMGTPPDGGLAWDSTNSRLFVSDLGNNRILVFNLVSGINDGMEASNVLGQANFTSGGCTLNAVNICGPAGLAYDATNTRLFVADGGWNRVTVFDLASGITNGMSASFVLGKPDFTTMSGSVSQSVIGWPISVAYDGSKYLFITDKDSGRIVVHNVTPSTLANGQNASGVIGQVTYTGFSTNSSLTGLNSPSNLHYDSSTNRLYAVDTTNNRVVVYDIARVTNSSLSNCDHNSSCSRTITSEDSQFTLSYSVASGALPTGLSLNSSTGAITGTPTVAGTSSFSLAATDTVSGGYFTAGSNKALTLTVNVDTTAPVISSVASGSVTTSGAVITWTTDEASSSIVDYGTTNAYGTSTTEADTSTRVTSHSVTLSGLSSATTYHFRVRSKDASNNTGTSSDQTVVIPAVPDTTAPTLSSIASSNITIAGATITWTTNEASSSQVEYGLTNVYGSSTTEADTSTRVTSHSVALTGLSAGTTYHYRVKSKDASNNTGTSSDQTFTTTSSGTSQQRTQTLSAQIDLTASFGTHRDTACLRMVNQFLRGERALPGRVTFAQDLSRVAGRTSLGSLADLLENTPLRGYLNALVRQDSTIAGLLQCQSSHSLILEVWNSGKAGQDQPLASVSVSTDLFGKADVTLPPLEVKAYDFTLRKPFGLRQTISGVTLASSLSLSFQTVRVGDLDGDGIIGLSDFKLFMISLGTLKYDLNEDGKIDLKDVTDLLESLRSR